jgi:cytochrome c-type biogenesis protein CcmH/NrfF
MWWLLVLLQMPTGFIGKNRPANDTEIGLMKELACMCPRCDRLPIDECECDFAADMRGEVKRELATKTPDAVRAHFVSKYGAEVLVKNKPPDRVGRFRWFPIVLFGVGAVLLFIVARRSLLRGRS